MSGFQVYYHHLVIQKDIPKLDQSSRKKIQKAIGQKLAAKPQKYAKPLQNTLKGLWSLRVGDWRVVFKISGNEIWILRIGHRREVYQKDVRSSGKSG
jgi:mRNA interferase RelE/StbE